MPISSTPLLFTFRYINFCHHSSITISGVRNKAQNLIATNQLVVSSIKHILFSLFIINRSFNIHQMFSFVLIVFQLVFIVMIGAFYRSKDFTNFDDGQVTYGLVTILGFVLMGAPYRKLTIFSLILLLFISFLTIEINFLMFNFW